VTREALRDDGVADDIDVAVSELLEDAVSAFGEAPDLMGVLSATKRAAKAHKARLGLQVSAAETASAPHLRPA
jgi:hypothetical protein